MRQVLHAALAFAGALIVSSGGFAQDAQLAMNKPDEFAWRLFLEVNSSVNGKTLFETWASDTDTFKPNPVFPPAPTPVAPHPPIVPALGLEAIQENGGLLPALPPNPHIGEESRRNQPAFDFIVQNNLFKRSGLIAAFGETLSFPSDSVEVKANWIPVADIPAMTNNRVSLADVARFFHVSAAANGDQYAMLSLHVISKAVPNWTWATFENEYNPGRCDILGCKDAFGATAALVPANAVQDNGYAACDKSPALAALFATANWDKAFEHYCLKGSQADFTDATGLATRLGDSVTESGFVPTSSCISCHGRANFTAAGRSTTQGGFNVDGSGPLGPIQPNWYWSFTANPPIFVGMAGLTQVATSVDFVWSVPFCAYEDRTNPPGKSGCTGK